MGITLAGHTFTGLDMVSLSFSLPLLFALVLRFAVRKVTVDIGQHLTIPTDIPEFLEQLESSHYVECNVPKAEAFIEQYGLDASEAALDFTEKAKEVFLRGKAVLDRIGVPFWLSSGTCLGETRIQAGC